MIRYKTVRGAVWEAVGGALHEAVYLTDGAVSEAVFVAVNNAVWEAVGGAVNRATDQPHPHLEEFLRELQGEER